MKKICFVLPRYVRHPIGGYKIVYEYANRLVKDNYQVYILYLNDTALNKKIMPQSLKNKVIEYFSTYGPNWFDLDKRFKQLSLTRIDVKSLLLKMDIAIATAATTVKRTCRLFPNSNIFYLIQDFEDWDITKSELYDTYRIPGVTNIVISKWLQNVLEEHTSKKVFYIQNPIDTKKYKVVNPIESRDPYTVGFLYHEAPFKGTKYTINAINDLRNKYPNLKIKAFGSYKKPKLWPNDFSYIRNASQKETIEFYNSISIFLNSSIKEGFGLTGLEAMACGAVLISTNYSGVQDYAQNGVNSLLSPVKDTELMIQNVEKILNNDVLRHTLALKGVESAQKYSWEKAYSKFKFLILG